MPNIPGATSVGPGVITNIVTQTNGASVPGGVRIAAIIGTGARSEIVVASANGGGNDGLNPTYTSTITGLDGRHFLLSTSPDVPGFTQLFKNGVPLVGIEGAITNNAFSDVYDYMFDPTTGQIELQTAHLVDQGGSFYTIGVTNVGVGTLTNLTLADVNAPPETWTIKCVSVQRNNLNQPIAGTASFVAFGSVSGNVVDANGNTIVWVANNTVATNSILSFSILETVNGMSVTISPFREGDYFTVQVASGVLLRGNSLTASYIAVSDINNPVFQDTISTIVTNYGSPSYVAGGIGNSLSLGCQLAFANQAPGIMCVEAAPPLPRRISYQLESNFNATSTDCENYQIPLPPNVTPDPNSQIHFFVTNPATGVETQLLPNQFPFFTLGTGGNPTICDFVFSQVQPPSGNAFSYSAVQENAVLNFAQDGYLNVSLTSPYLATFESASHIFQLSDVGKYVNITNAVNLANISSSPGTDEAGPGNELNQLIPGWAITSVSQGAATIAAVYPGSPTPPFADFVDDSAATFELVDIFGNAVPGTSGTVAIVAVPNTATATFTSVVDLSAYDIIGDGYQIRVLTSPAMHPETLTNIGLFDVTAFTAPYTLTVTKTFVSEHDLTFEVVDATQTSSYIVVNQQIVPNGYSLRVTVVDTQDATFFDAGWVNALASLETQQIDVLVTLPQQTISVIFENALNHCLEMSNLTNRRERVLLLGAISGLTPANLTGAQLAAVEQLGIIEGIPNNDISTLLGGQLSDIANYSVPNAYGETFRAVYFFPDQIVVQVGSNATTIDGFYLAAAGAGYLSGQNNVAVPLTNKILSGFTINQNRMFNQLTNESLFQAGVCVVSPVSGGGNVLWGLTTTQSGYPEEQEISIVFIRDRIAKQMRAGFAGYIGNPEDLDTQGTLTARAVAMMNSFITQGLITNFANLSVINDPVEPRQWDITVAVQPVYPINWIYITVGVGTIA